MGPLKPLVRHEPIFRDLRVRTVLGLLVFAGSAYVAGETRGEPAGAWWVALAVAWGISVFFTHKYLHKYPQRYVSYLLASHGKAAGILVTVLVLSGFLLGFTWDLWLSLGLAALLSTVGDFLVSLPCRRAPVLPQPVITQKSLTEPTGAPADAAAPVEAEWPPSSPDAPSLAKQVADLLEPAYAPFLAEKLPEWADLSGKVHAADDRAASLKSLGDELAGVVVAGARVNDIRRINRFLLACVARMPMGGFLVARYLPLENATAAFAKRHAGGSFKLKYLANFAWHRICPKIPWLNALYFAVTKGRARLVSKAEVWGRLASCGLNIVAESSGDGEVLLIARRESLPVQNRRPSYYPVVGLEKVGLDGQIIRTHKLRSMYPFSEFIQKRIFEDNGLAITGKFKDDFRLTEYGPFFRKNWLDELPQIFDWLRGDIKLVGIRATSRHFLSLYPQDFLDLYVQVKPGLIPPIFDETTDGFEHIVKVEEVYLEAYCKQPLRTDIRYFMMTFKDIVFRGIRSR